MRKPSGYCKGCKDRTAEDPDKGTRDCHRDCEKYKQFRRELAEYYRQINIERSLDYVTEHRPWFKGVKKND